MTHTAITTLGQLKKAGYQSRSVKDEMRQNLITALKNGNNLWEEIKGYDETVIPQLQTAILSRHNIILLGLRGQAKTRIARLLLNLLDEYMPIIEGSEINDDPLMPLSRFGLQTILEMGDETPIQWVHRNLRYTEKLATPDVSVSDLIGDVDPIKAATLKLPYSDERVIHFGLIPRSHRGLFVINELPDLQARIQVSLFNILQEGDIQIRGFKLRLPLDIQFVFTANPEDYTNRGSIVTPLKDRIDSQILTHYPKSIDIAQSITEQEADVKQKEEYLTVFPILRKLIERVAFEARDSELIDKKSGVSARLTISALENLYSSAERRMYLTNEKEGHVRIGDLIAIIPSITGKVELVYEGETEGVSQVAQLLLGKSIRKEFLQIFPDPNKLKKKREAIDNPYSDIIDWFNENILELKRDLKTKEYEKALVGVKGLDQLIKKYMPQLSGKEKILWMEFALHGLAELSQLSRFTLDGSIQFKDLMSGMMGETGNQEE